MGKGAAVLAGVLGLQALLLASLLHTPVPPTMEAPWKYRTIMAVFKLQGFLAYLVSKTGGDALEFLQKSTRHMLELTAPTLHESVQSHNDVYDGVAVRVYQRKDGGPDRPALLYLHGGGFYYGTPYAYEYLSEMMVMELNMVVISVDYRLSLQHPSPAPLEDCHKVAQYVHRQARHLGINPDKIGVAGDSAGGALSAALALWLRDHEEKPRLAYQVLFYPWLQAFDLQLPSYVADTEGRSLVSVPGLAASALIYVNKTRSYMKHLLKNAHISPEVARHYENLVDWRLLPKEVVAENYQKAPRGEATADFDPEVERQVLDPYNFPLMAKDLSDLPPAYILTVDHDVLRDDGLLYARRLEKDGTPALVHNDVRGWHGMLTFLKGILSFDVANEVAHQTVDFIKSKL